jgi:hypothetical protein
MELPYAQLSSVATCNILLRAATIDGSESVARSVNAGHETKPSVHEPLPENTIVLRPEDAEPSSCETLVELRIDWYLLLRYLLHTMSVELMTSIVPWHIAGCSPGPTIDGGVWKTASNVSLVGA